MFLNVQNTRSEFRNADGDYTPAQRRVIDARLAKADDDIKHGRTYGPFETADEAIKAINKEIRARKAWPRINANKSH